MCFSWLIFQDLMNLFYSLLYLRSSEWDVVSLYVVRCSVNVSVCFVCCMFVNCLVKQFVMCLGVVAILWLNVMRKGDEDWVTKCMEYRVEDRRPIGRPRRTSITSTTQTHNVLQHSKAKKALFSTTAATEQTFQQTTTYKTKHAPYTYIYCL